MIKLGAHTEWTKSTHSQQNACVEVKSTDVSAVRISDSKFTGSARPEFAASPEAFAAFTAFARS